MAGKGYVPLTEEEMLERLSLPPQHLSTLRQALRHLVEKGMAETTQQRYALIEGGKEIVKGTLRAHPRGFGFVQPEDALRYSQDIFIPKPMMNNAVDGDTVEVLILNMGLGEKGPEGKILSIIERGRTHIAGIVCQAHKEEAYAYVPILGRDQQVRVLIPSGEALHEGDRVVMEVIEWGDKDNNTLCRFSHKIGHISDSSCDIIAAIEEFELPSTFSEAAKKEAVSFGKQVKKSEIANREDFRDWEIFTIDPDTAKDFDDALSLNKDDKGCYHLGVHIADVSHYVTPGSKLDEEAALRCNSVYFPGYCLPMLPEELSSNLCSLKANVNRLTASVLMTFDSKGEMVDYRICRSVIRSAKRFTYREAKQVLDNKKKSPHASTLKLMVELCLLLKKKRYERGSLEFALADRVILVDEKGFPTGLDYVEYDITHQLVEEFMLKTNEIIAKHLSMEGKNLTFRIHEEPDEEALKEFSGLANIFGFKLPESPSPYELQQLFSEAILTPYGQYLATNYIRRMKMAYYSPNNIGHYGLSLEYYCHFTSPIRRYVDTIAHRILFGESDDLQKLEAIAEACSEQERISAKAENSVILLKKLRLLQEMQKQNPKHQFDAIVTQVKPFGIAFDVIDLMLDSFLHISTLGNDYFVYDDLRKRLVGRHEGGVFTCGNKITVMLKTVDLITLESEWHLVSTPSTSKTLTKTTSKRQKVKKQRQQQKASRKKNATNRKKRKR